MKRFATIFYVFAILTLLSAPSFASTYYSQNSSSPSTFTNWNTNPLGGGGFPTAFSTGDIFIIQTGHSMTLSGGSWILSGLNSELRVNGSLTINSTSSITVQRCSIFATGSLTIAPGNNFTVNNGNAGGYDLIVNGSLYNSGNLSYGASATGQMLGDYYHQVNGGTIPVFTWDPSSVCHITGITSATTLAGLSQSFGHFYYNSVSQTSTMNFNSQLISVGGTFSVEATGSGSLVLFSSMSNLNVGYFSQIGGTLDFSTASGVSDTIKIISNNSGFYQTAGTTYTSGSGSKGIFLFSGSNATIIQTGTIGANIGYRVLQGLTIESSVNTTLDFVAENNSVLYSLGYFIYGTGNFYLNAGARLQISNSDGITSSGATGEIQVSGTRAYDINAHYEYVGAASQVTGDGLPTSVQDLFINKSNVVTLTSSLAVNGTMTLQSGVLDVASNTLLLNSTVTRISGLFNSNANGTTIYNSGSPGQVVATGGSQYGNLTFNNGSKNLPGGLMCISGTFSPGFVTPSVNFTNIIEFNGLATQTIPAFQYYNLTISGARGANDVILTNSGSIVIEGTFSPTTTFSSGNFITSGSTVEFYGGSSQTAPSLPGGASYHHLVVNKNDGGLTAGDHLSLNGNLTLFMGDLYDNGYTISVKGNIDGNNGYHITAAGGRILLTGGSSQHQISNLYLETVELDDVLGAITVGSPVIKNVILTSGEFTLNDPLYISAGGTISATAGSFGNSGQLIFNGGNIVTGIISFDYVEINGGVDFGSSSTITGVLKINSGGYVWTNAPIYGIGSLLHYYTGGVFSRGMEWSSTSGPGYPHNIQISNTTELNLGANGGTGTARQNGGNLIIDLSSKLRMNQSGYVMTQPLTVLGNLELYGWLILSGNTGGELKVGGNWIQGGPSSSFSPNGGWVYFIGTGDQLITRGNNYSVNFNSIVVDKPSGDIVFDDVASTNIFIDSSLALLGGGIDLRDRALTFQYNGGYIFVNNGLHTIKGLAGSQVVFNGTKSVGSGNSGSLEFTENVAITVYANNMDFGGSLTTINGMLKIADGSVINGGGPIYGIGSTLEYDVESDYDRGGEWSATSGPGYPYHVHVLNSTTLNIGDYFGLSIALQTGGNLTIDAASEISMNVDGREMWWPLTVNGNLINNGTLTLSGAYNGSLILKGNFENNGSLISNTRPVTFSGNFDQLITRNTAGVVSFDSLVIDKASSVVEVSTSPIVELAIIKNLTLLNGLLRLNGTITSVAANATITAVSGNLDTLPNEFKFYGFNSISGTVDFGNMKLFGAVDFGSDSKLHGMMYLMSGGSVSSNPPLYLPGSTLVYHSGGTFYRDVEWSTLSGPGHPFNVELNNSTYLNFGGYSETLPTSIDGNLIVMGGSTFSMSEDGWELSAPLTVYGSVANYGTIILSYVFGNDLNIQGDLIQNDAILTTNVGVLSFFGNGNSTIDGVGTISKLRMNKSSGFLTLGNSIYITDTLFLQCGNINAGIHAVEVSSAGTVTRTNGHIIGDLKKYLNAGVNIPVTFEVGDETNYSPVELVIANIFSGGGITANVSATGPALTSSGISNVKYTAKYWRLSNNDIGIDMYDAVFHFAESDVVGGADPFDFIAELYNGETWFPQNIGIKNTLNTQVLGVSEFGTFAIGEAQTFEVVATAGTGGSIDPVGTIEVPYYGSQAYTITPDAGYTIQDVLVDSVSQGPITEYTFSNVTGNHTIEATFAPVVAIPTGVFAISGNGQVEVVWNKNIGAGIKRYIVYQGVSPNPTTRVDSSADGNLNDTSIVISGLTNGVQYYFRVTAVYVNDEESGYSADDAVVPRQLPGNALSLNGLTQYAVVPHNNSLNLTGGFTLEAWVYLTAPSTFMQIIGKGQPSSTGYSLSISDQHIGFATWGIKDYVLFTSVSLNEWHQVSVVFDAAYDAHFYLDGQFIGSDPGDYPATQNSDSLFIGINPDYGNYIMPFVGNLDEIRIWDHERTTEQIAAGFNQAVRGDEPGLIAGWKFDESTGVINSNEVSPNANDLLLRNSVSFIHSGAIIPSAPLGFSATPQTGGGYIIWNKNRENDISFYRIYLGTSPNPTTLVDSTATANDTSKFFTGLTVGTPYYVRITAVDTAGFESEYSNEETMTPYLIHSIEASVFGNGTITPPGSSPVNDGDSLYYSIVANANHHIDSIVIDVQYEGGGWLTTPEQPQNKNAVGKNSGYITKHRSTGTFATDSTIVIYGTGNADTARNYTFLNVTSDHTIDAYFSINTYTITATIAGNGTITPSGVTMVNYGDSAAYAITPDIFHHVDSLVIDSVNQGSLSAYTFLNINTNHTIAAYISANPNIAPLFTVTLPDTAFPRFDTLYFQYIASDPDSGGLRFSVLSSPSGVSIDSMTGALTYVPAANANGQNMIVVQVTDDSLAAVIDTAIVRVNIYGDVSGNGFISAFDAALVLQHVVELDTLQPLQQRVADVSGNGGISALDASYMLQYAVGLISTFPGGLGKQVQADAVLSAFSFRIQKGEIENQYDLFVSVNKPSNVFGIVMDLEFDSTIVDAQSMHKTTLTDSMTMMSNFPDGKANLALAGIYPLNAPGDIIKFSFVLKDPNYPKNAVLFTLNKFILNETDYTNDIGGITLNIRDLAQMPAVYKLEQNFPNPFNPTTTINYQLPEASAVKIIIYNLLGQEVRTIVNEHHVAGYYSQQWNGRDHTDRPVSSGVYIYRIEVAGEKNKRFVEVKKMLMIK